MPNLRFVQIRVMAVCVLLMLLCPVLAGSEELVYKGVFKNISATDECGGIQAREKMVLILDNRADGTMTGTFYGTGMSPGWLKQISTGTFEMITPITEFRGLKPDLMHLSGRGNSLRITINANIPYDPAIRDGYCWTLIPSFNVKLTKDRADVHHKRFEQEIVEERMNLEGRNLLYKEYDYDAALKLGRKIIAIMDQQHGRYSKKSLDVLDLVVIPLIYQERYDEALQSIEPYYRKFPKNKDLRELELGIKQLKKEQDKLFQYNPGSDDATELEPIA